MLPCPSPSPGACSNSSPLSQWCHSTISSSVCPLLLLPSIFPSIRVFSNESALRIRWPKYWSFSFSLSPSNEYSGLISSRIDRFAVPWMLTNNICIHRTTNLEHMSPKTFSVSDDSVVHTHQALACPRTLVSSDSSMKALAAPSSLPSQTSPGFCLPSPSRLHREDFLTVCTPRREGRNWGWGVSSQDHWIRTPLLQSQQRPWVWKDSWKSLVWWLRGPDPSLDFTCYDFPLPPQYTQILSHI